MPSLDWLLDTDETLALRLKPKAARRACGKAEKPGGRRPEWPGFSTPVFWIDSEPALFCSVGPSQKCIHF